LKNRLAVSFLRAMTLRCPRCGGRGILKSWFHMRPACPTCALALERGEEDDYWYGGFMFNIIAAELLSMGTVAILIVATYPRVPWTALEILGPALAVSVPFLTFPFARCVWLAWDLTFRPAEPGD
jgi:uncharacterized protein (DUF983 family)